MPLQDNVNNVVSCIHCTISMPCLFFCVSDFSHGSDSYMHTSPGSSSGHQGSCTSSPLASPNLGPQGAAPGSCRYFVMKCGSQKNIDVSVNKGAWATSRANEKKLNKAFQVNKIAIINMACLVSFYCF